jgi:hypothetical protein
MKKMVLEVCVVGGWLIAIGFIIWNETRNLN